MGLAVRGRLTRRRRRKLGNGDTVLYLDGGGGYATICQNPQNHPLKRVELQYFSHLMQKTDSLEKDPDAGKD